MIIINTASVQANTDKFTILPTIDNQHVIINIGAPEGVVGDKTIIYVDLYTARIIARELTSCTEKMTNILTEKFDREELPKIQEREDTLRARGTCKCGHSDNWHNQNTMVPGYVKSDRHVSVWRLYRVYHEHRRIHGSVRRRTTRTIEALSAYVECARR